MAVCAACKVVICCSGLSGKISRIDDLVLAGKINNPRVLERIIAGSEEMEEMLDQLVELIYKEGRLDDDDD